MDDPTVNSSGRRSREISERTRLEGIFRPFALAPSGSGDTTALERASGNLLAGGQIVSVGLAKRANRDPPGGCRNAAAPPTGIFAQPHPDDRCQLSGEKPADRLEKRKRVVFRQSGRPRSGQQCRIVAMDLRIRGGRGPLVPDFQPRPARGKVRPPGPIRQNLSSGTRRASSAIYPPPLDRATASLLDNAGIREDSPYRSPVVDLGISRKRALEAWSSRHFSERSPD